MVIVWPVVTAGAVAVAELTMYPSVAGSLVAEVRIGPVAEVRIGPVVEVSVGPVVELSGLEHATSPFG